MASWLLLVLGVISLWATFVALVRVNRPAALSLPTLVASLIASGWPLFQIAVQPVIVGLLVAADGLAESAGAVGLVLYLISWIGLVVVRIVQSRARPTAESALRAGLGDDYLDRLAPERRDALRSRPGLGVLLLPFRNDSTGIVRVRDIPYGDHPKRQLLDVYHPADDDGPFPVILQTHGGAWVIGHKRQQGMPLVHRMVQNGYVAVSINYRLGPKYHFPDQLIDVKRAIAWTRANIADYGGDPDTIILTGGSAGGHLSALAALTPNEAEFQPGFEDADTSVTACMPFYGPTDFTDSDGIRGRMDAFEVYLKRTVMPGSMDEYGDLYRAMSPITHIRPDAPPFLIIQGTIDVLVWREENRAFADRLAATSQAPVVYWEVPGAQHAFDVYNSRRCSVAVDVCERFAGWVVAETTVQS